MSEPLPIKYALEIYSSSFANDPFFSVQSQGPFGSISVGDTIDRRSFPQYDGELTESISLQVKQVRHIFWELENTQLTHKTMITVEPISDDEVF